MSHLNFAPFPTLTTERLTLRQITHADAPQMFRLRTDESVGKYVELSTMEKVDDARRFIANINNNIDKNESIFWAIALKNEDEMIGSICLWNFSADKTKAEVGYDLMPDYQGKGMMQEAVSAVLDYAFKTLALVAVEGVVHPENASSIKLLVRNGFVVVGSLFENDVDMTIYELENKMR